MRAAVVQMSSGEHVRSNLEVASRLVRLAARDGARLVVLPEGFAFLGDEAEKCRLAEAVGGSGPISSWLRALGTDAGVWIVAGGLPETSGDPLRPFNTSVVTTPGGEVAAIYRKVHLFDVDLDDGTKLSESRSTMPGESIQIASVLDHQVGLSICYDVRFPRLYEAARLRGATVLTVPAAFTRTTGEAHWHVLLRARAIETQCYVLAAAQFGEHPLGRRTYGHSMIVDPWGAVVAELREGEGFVSAELDLDAVLRVRRQMPVFSHRKLV